MDLHGLFFKSLFCSTFFCLFGDPIFNHKPESQDVVNGNSTFLQCSVEGPDAENYTISWLSGGKLIANNQRRYQKGSNLYFREVDKDLDSNEFQCQATENATGAEFVSSSAQLNIKWLQVGNVELKSPLEPSQILPNVKGGVTLKCNITGVPKPNNLSWYVNGTRIRGRKAIRIKDGKIIIRRPKIGVDDGSYTCCATYPFGPLSNRHKCTPAGGAFKLHVLSRTRPKLVKKPQDKVVVKGSNVLIDCVYTAVPSPEIIWRRGDNSKLIPQRPSSKRCKKKCSYQNGTLALFNVKDGMVGEYQCYAKQGEVETGPASVMVRLAYINQFEVPSTMRFVLVGEKFEYHCEVPESVPPAKIIWTRARDGRVIDQENRHIATIAMKTLIIDNVEKSDAGVYTCTAENIADRVSRNVTIELKVSPTFGTLSDKQANEGSTVTWSCPVQGKPPPMVTWHKGDAELYNIPGKRMIKNAELTLLDVDITDQGMYYCSATNDIAQSGSKPVQSNMAHLRISERLKFWPKPKDACIFDGEKAQVMCRVNGSDVMKIRWSKLDSKQDVHQLTHRHSQSLIFTKANKSSAGLYRCVATASPLTINATIRIDVVKRPEVVVSPQSMNVSEGSEVMLQCHIKQGDSSKVTWQFGDESYTSSQAHNEGSHLKVLGNGSLVIHRAQSSDAGSYTCSYTICDFTTSDASLLSVYKDSPKNPYDDHPDDSPAPNSQMVQTIALCVSGGIVYVLLTIAVLIYCRRKRRRKRENNDEQTEEERMLNGSSCNGRQRGNHDDEISNINNSIPMETLYRLDPEINNLMYPAQNIDPIVVIGKGEFGNVFLSKAPGLFPDLEEDILVMVKAYQPNQDAEETSSLGSSPMGTRSEFNREINLLHRASHENVVKLLAVCSKHSELKPDHLITEYLEWGILKLCLEASRDGRISKLGKNHKMSICCQLACGLDHLNKLGLVHKDIAARNCVISSQLLVKISMLGLTREGFENDYHNVDGKRLPIRWMAPEALMEDHFTSKSDVWSFAVTCWEIFTLGETPYDELADEQYIDALRSDDWPHLPPLEGSKRITSLIKKCCRHSPHDRPEIKQIMRKLQSIIGSEDAPGDDNQLERNATVAMETLDYTTDNTEER